MWTWLASGAVCVARTDCLFTVASAQPATSAVIANQVTSRCIVRPPRVARCNIDRGARPWYGLRRMEVLRSNLDTRSETYRTNREGFLEQIAYLDEQLALARAGGGEKYVQRHLQRGKLMARERIELLLDRDSPFLEVAPLCAWGTDFGLGGSVISGIGVVSGVEWAIPATA